MLKQKDFVSTSDFLCAGEHEAMAKSYKLFVSWDRGSRSGTAGTGSCVLTGTENGRSLEINFQILIGMRAKARRRV